MINSNSLNQQLWPAIQVGPTSLMDPTLVDRRKGFQKKKKKSIKTFPFAAQNNNYMLLIKFPTFLGFTTRHKKKKSLPCVIQKSDLRPFNCRVGRPQNNKQIS